MNRKVLSMTKKSAKKRKKIAVLKHRILLIVVALISIIGVTTLVLTKASTTTVIVNDNVIGSGVNQWQYSGTGWRHYTGEPAKYMGDDHSSSQAGDIATLRFNGIKAEYHGAKSPQAGIVAISIDNGSEVMVDLYSATRYDNTLLYTSPVLSSGEHTMRIRLTGTKNPSATQAAAAVDRAIVTVENGANGHYVNIEPENGTLSSGATVIGDQSVSNGKSVKFASGSTTPTDPGGTTGTAPMPFPAKAAGLYHMMWSNSKSPKLSTTPANINVIYLAFAQGDPPSLVGWTAQGEASFVTDAKALRAKGVRMVISVGGAQGYVNTSSRQNFVNGIMNINSKIPLDGIDWDIEGSALNAGDIVWISTELKRLRGSNFAITMAPGGGHIHSYPPVAVELHKANALDLIGWQFYDTVVSKEAALSRVNSLVSAGIPINKIGVGMMVGDADTYWTVDECITNFNYIKASHPNIRGGYLWEAGRAGTGDWANRVAPLLLK